MRRAPEYQFPDCLYIEHHMLDDDFLCRSTADYGRWFVRACVSGSIAVEVEALLGNS